jgi:acetyl esterase
MRLDAARAMLGSDPAIDFRPALSARVLQAAFPLTFRLRYSSPALQFASKQIAEPARITIPTRHGAIKARQR